jgi:lipopolysaccharide transport system permease protein
MESSSPAVESWDIIVRPKSRWSQLDLKGVWQYRDLIRLFVRRDFVAQYKQTLLGPLWMLIQPLLTTILFSFVFARMARIPTGGVPSVLFYMSAFIAWTYFSDCVQKTSSTFTANAAIFGKVYFPRLVTPVSQVISSIFKFLIQFLLLIGLFIFFRVRGGQFSVNIHLLYMPLLLLLLAGMGMAIGLIISSLTTRFRDLSFLVGFIIQLLMYGSSVIFSALDPKIFGPHLMAILKWNPLVWIIEGFRYSLLGTGTWSWSGLAYSGGCMFFLLTIALLLFGKVEKSFMDTV